MQAQCDGGIIDAKISGVKCEFCESGNIMPDLLCGDPFWMDQGKLICVIPLICMDCRHGFSVKLTIERGK